MTGVKAGPAHLLAIGLVLLLLAGTRPLLAGERTDKPLLLVESSARQLETGEIELELAWHWQAPAPSPQWQSQEHLLALSFDTQSLVWEREESPWGAGADGQLLKRLEQAYGTDGARRLFVLPEGKDGTVRLYFRPAWNDAPPSARPLDIFVVFRSEETPIWTGRAPLNGEHVRLDGGLQGVPH